MSDNFVQYNRCEKARWLRKKYPNAFLLLSLIAENARRTSGHIDGLLPGDALIGKPEDAGLTRQSYRTALEKLVDLGIIKIIGNGKSFFEREKSTIKVTITGHLVSLLDSEIFNINKEDTNQQINQRPTNDQPTTNHKQESNKKEKKEKKNKTKVFLSDSDEIGLSILLFQSIKKILPEARQPNFQTWAKHFNAMLRLDNRNVEQIREMIAWLETSHPDAIFWRQNILSPEKLRKQWDMLTLKRKVVPLKNAPTSNRETVITMFKNGEIYNGATCWLDDSAIAFERGMTHYSLKFNEKGFQDQFDNLLRKFGINKQTEVI